jgi:hypothetical protein
VTPKRISYALGVVVLVASGAYLLVYLYRWEWNRAMIAGLFFVSAEIGLATATIVSRIARVEARLLREHPTVHERIREAAPEPRNHFAWLEQDAGRMQVFVPVLLGAGVVMSGLAWLVDRLAQLTARPALEHQLTGRVAALSFPPGGLFGTAGPPVPHARMMGVRHLVAVVVVAGVAWGGLDVLADATQNRPDMPLPDMHTTVALEVETKGVGRAAEQLIEALWVTCRGTLSSRAQLTALTPLGANRAAIEVRPALGAHAIRRFRGCLEDATMDRMQASVLSIETLPN